MMTKKKNVLMRSAGLLLVLVLVTSCFVGSTFAKYTVGGTGSDTARVAKFGVNVTASGTMFAKEYATDDGNAGTITKSVISTDKKVVAPGTKGNMASMTLTGTPEVAVRVSYAVNKFELKGWTTDGTTEYCPLVFTVGTASYKIGDAGITSVSDLQDKVTAAITAYSKDYEAHTDLSGVGADSLKVSWAWAFEGDDAKDTALGSRAAEDKAATVELEITTTVTQID